MGASGPPRADQLSTWPVKISRSWARLRPETGLEGWTIPATPSRATVRAAAPLASSDSFSGRLERPMSALPASAASTPAPDPVPE